ncbi:MAG: carboxylesterase family protein, partial [Candidatus Thiodiazotropha sp.]
ESGSLVQCLQSISAETLEGTLNNFTNGLFAVPSPFVPSIDGEFFSAHPRDLLLSENAGSSVFSGVDFMSGICAEEGAALLQDYSGMTVHYVIAGIHVYVLSMQIMAFFQLSNDDMFYKANSDNFSDRFSKLDCEPLLESPHQGGSNKDPQFTCTCMFKAGTISFFI